MIIEKEDAFEIETQSLVVRACRHDAFFREVDLVSLDTTWTLRIEGSFSLKHDGVDEREETARLDDLVGKSVLSVRARKTDGQLDVTLERDWLLTVYPDNDYEPWQIYSSRGEMLVSVPSDGIAVWRA